jgi:tungstate transport system ATP-binding protein
MISARPAGWPTRVLFLHRGRLIEDAPAADFFAGPASPEARAFLAGELLW